MTQLENFRDDLSRVFDEFCKIYQKIDIEYFSLDKSHKKEVFDSKYIPPKICSDLQNYIYRAGIKYNNIEIYICSNKPLRNKDYIDYVEFIMFFTRFIIYTFNKIKILRKPLYVYLYLTDHKKEFPLLDKSLTPENVNSGLKTTYHDKIEIIIYRKEELFKVIIHELTHAFELDDISSISSQEELIKNYFQKNVSLRIQESVTDTLACLYNIAIFSKILSIILKLPYNYIFEYVYFHEYYYIIRKAKQVLIYEGYDINDDGIAINNRYRKGEDTHVISYYVLKAMNFYQINNFLNYISTKTPNYTIIKNDFWNFLKTQDHLQSQILRMSNIDIENILKIKKNKLLKGLVSE